MPEIRECQIVFLTRFYCFRWKEVKVKRASGRLRSVWLCSKSITQFSSPYSCFHESLMHRYHKFHYSPITRWLMGWFIHSQKLSLASINIRYYFALTATILPYLPPSILAAKASWKSYIFRSQCSSRQRWLLRRKFKPRTFTSIQHDRRDEWLWICDHPKGHVLLHMYGMTSSYIFPHTCKTKWKYLACKFERLAPWRSMRGIHMGCPRPIWGSGTVRHRVMGELPEAETAREQEWRGIH